jgi:microcystin-dependent protein
MAPSMVGPTGGNQPVPIIQPVLCVTFIIAMQGIFPSRS